MAKPKRVTATVRNAHVDDRARIVEASADNGAGLLIEVHQSADGRTLYVYPYRADRDVYLMTRSHSEDCTVYQSRAADRHCDCGACSTFDAKSGAWRPTAKAV